MDMLLANHKDPFKEKLLLFSIIDISFLSILSCSLEKSSINKEGNVKQLYSNKDVKKKVRKQKVC